MVLLDKDKILFNRNEDGELLPVTVKLELLESEETQEIKIKPLTRGKIQEISIKLQDKQLSSEVENEILLKHCIEPSFSDDELKRLPPTYSNAIVIAVFATSLGISQKELNEKTAKKSIELEELMLKKK